MKNGIILLFSALLICCTSLPPQSARDAYIALKKVEAKTQTGVNFIQYMEALSDAIAMVNVFLDSRDSEKFAEVKTSLQKVAGLYLTASLVWKAKILGWHKVLDQGEATNIKQRIAEMDPVYKEVNEIADPGERVNRLRAYHARFGGKETEEYFEKSLQIVWQKASEEMKTIGHSFGN